MENDNSILIIVFLLSPEEIELMQSLLLEESLKDSETFIIQDFMDTDYLKMEEMIDFIPKVEAQKHYHSGPNNFFLKKGRRQKPQIVKRFSRQ